jgi:polar amino acid transport system substrate-binding protein
MLRLVDPDLLTLATMDLDGRPMFWTGTDGTQRGYEAEVAAATASRLGLVTRWVPLPFAAMLPTLQGGGCDAVWACQAITPARLEVVDFSIPYGRFDEAVAVLRTSLASGPDDFAGKRVGAIAGSSNLALVETFPGATAVAFPGSSQDVMTEMADAVRAGAVEAFVDDEQVLTPYAEASHDLRIAFVHPTQIPYGVAVRKDATELREAIDWALRDLIADGQLEAIWRRWFPHRSFSL